MRITIDVKCPCEQCGDNSPLDAVPTADEAAFGKYGDELDQYERRSFQCRKCGGTVAVLILDRGEVYELDSDSMLASKFYD